MQLERSQASKLCKAGRRQGAGKVQLQSHLQPIANLESWKKELEKEAAARLIPPRPFAEAAEEVGHTGRSLRGCLLALLDGASRQVLGLRAGALAWLGTILEWEHDRMHCYNNHSLLPKCGWQS